MKSELQKKLLKKYPHFFTDERKIYTGEKTVEEDVKELLKQKEIVLPIQFGFECDDGWYVLISELFACIEQHLNPKNSYPKKERIPFQITQIKEKWGGLRIYYYGGDNVVEGMVDFAEHLSYCTCEECGSTKNIGRTTGWVKTLCSECGKAYPNWEIYDEDKENEDELL